MIQSYPEAGARQGASDYLRHALQRPGIDPEAARRFHDALAKYAADT